MTRSPIDDDALRAIARLAMLELPAERLPLLRRQLEAILDAVDAIGSLDLEGVPEWTPAPAPAAPGRADEPHSPRASAGFLRAPRVRPR